MTNFEQTPPIKERSQLLVRIPEAHKMLAARIAHMEGLDLGQYIDSLIVADIAKNADILRESLQEEIAQTENKAAQLQKYIGELAMQYEDPTASR